MNHLSNIRNKILAELVTNKWINLQPMHWQDGDLCGLYIKSNSWLHTFLSFRKANTEYLLCSGWQLFAALILTSTQTLKQWISFPFVKFHHRTFKIKQCTQIVVIVLTVALSSKHSKIFQGMLRGYRLMEGGKQPSNNKQTNKHFCLRVTYRLEKVA